MSTFESVNDCDNARAASVAAAIDRSVDIAIKAVKSYSPQSEVLESFFGNPITAFQFSMRRGRASLTKWLPQL